MRRRMKVHRVHLNLFTGLMMLLACAPKNDDMNTAETNKQQVRSFFQAIEAEDASLIADHFAANGTHVNPYHSELFPVGAEGKEGVENYWKPVFPNFDGMQFEIHQLLATEDPNLVFTEYTGKIKLKGNAGYYTNHYFSTFRFDGEGKITEYIEIFNPITAAKAFGLADQIK